MRDANGNYEVVTLTNYNVALGFTLMEMASFWSFWTGLFDIAFEHFIREAIVDSSFDPARHANTLLWRMAKATTEPTPSEAEFRRLYAHHTSTGIMRSFANLTGAIQVWDLQASTLSTNPTAIYLLGQVYIFVSHHKSICTDVNE